MHSSWQSKKSRRKKYFWTALLFLLPALSLAALVYVMVASAG